MARFEIEREVVVIGGVEYEIKISPAQIDELGKLKDAADKEGKAGEAMLRLCKTIIPDLPDDTDYLTLMKIMKHWYELQSNIMGGFSGNPQKPTPGAAAAAVSAGGPPTSS